jgi:hypothetical protein
MEEFFWDSLPDMSDAVLTERVDLGRHSFLVQVSPVRQFDDYGPDVDVVHAWALRPDGVPLALRDIYPNAAREEAYELWSFLCEQLGAAGRLVYGVKTDVDGRPTVRLGCWGPRPDLVGDDADDGATALVVGVAVDTRDAQRPGRDELFALTVRSALVATLRRWVSAAQPRRIPDPRAN